MLTWDIRWKEREADVASLSPPDRLKLSLVCIDDVLADLASSLQPSLPAELRSSIRAALDSLWSGSWNDQSAVQSDLESHLENDDIPGLYDLLMAMYTLVYIGKDPGTEDSLESISFSYQAILDTEILSCLDRDMMEAEVRECEKRNARCMRCIDRQLSLLDEISAAATPCRKGFQWLEQ